MPNRTKFTASVVRKIIEGLKLGMPRKYAAARGGISERCFFSWLDERPNFKQKVLAAEAHAVAHHLENLEIRAKKRGSWEADAWLLERRFASDYGKAERLQVTQDVNVNVVARRELILRQIVGELPTSGVGRIVAAMDERPALPAPAESKNDQ
jgi:hypothetical protein